MATEEVRTEKGRALEDIDNLIAPSSKLKPKKTVIVKAKNFDDIVDIEYPKKSKKSSK